MRRDDLYIDRGVSGARASRPNFDRAVDALQAGDTLLITTLDRLGRSTQDMLAFSDKISSRGAGEDLGGRPWAITDSRIRSARRLIDGGEPATQVARDFGMSRATFYRRSRALASIGEPPDG